jgi:hypothetical protein
MHPRRKHAHMLLTCPCSFAPTAYTSPSRVAIKEWAFPVPTLSCNGKIQSTVPWNTKSMPCSRPSDMLGRMEMMHMQQHGERLLFLIFKQRFHTTVVGAILNTAISYLVATIFEIVTGERGNRVSAVGRFRLVVALTTASPN